MVSEGSWQQYEAVVQRNVMVPLRDGTHLATDVYLPAHGGEVVDGMGRGYGGRP